MKPLGFAGRFAGLLLFATLVVPGSLSNEAEPFLTPGEPYVAGELLVKFREGADRREVDHLRRGLGARRVHRFRRGAEHLVLGPGRTTESAIRQLSRHPLVEYAEPNYIVAADVLPNDPLLPELYGMKNLGQTGGTPGADIDAEAAWDITTGDRRVVVAVIDSGVDYTHPDLADNVWTNPGEIPNNGIDDDGNGYVDDVHGWSFWGDSNDTKLDSAHGTHVSGIIGAVGDNGIGVTGVSWKVSIMPLKFLGGPFVTGTIADAILAIEYATAMGADIANNSWSGGPHTQALLDAIVEANEAGVLFVASAGNQALDLDVSPRYPASYDVPNVLTVAATDADDGLADFSSYGAMTIDLGAPGVEILSTTHPEGYDYLTGTSMSAPHAAGAAALILAAVPNITVQELHAMLLDGVDPVPSLEGCTVSGGRLSVSGALAARDGTPPERIDDLTLVVANSNDVVLSWTAPGDGRGDEPAALYDIRYATTPLDAETFREGTRVHDTRAPATPGERETFEVGGLETETTYYFALRAEDAWGNAADISNIVSGTTLAAPTLELTPGSLEVATRISEVARGALTVTNIGAGTLDWSVVAEAGLPDWLSVAPSGGRLTSGASVEAVATFVPPGLSLGLHEGVIAIGANDPDAPLTLLPVAMTVAGAPDIALVGEPLTIESRRGYDTDGARTEHTLAVVIPPSGGGEIELAATGDFGRDFEIASVTAEGILVGALAETGSDCDPASESFAIGADLLAMLAADDVVQVEVQNSEDVGVFCAINEHTVRLHYRGPTDALDHGSVFVGGHRDRAVVIENRGTDPLEITSITVDEPAFDHPPGPFSVPPLSSETLPVTFAPEETRSFSGTLRIESTDPDTPLIEVGLSGTAIEAPVLAVDPARIDSVFYLGGSDARALTISNTGGHDLEYSIGVVGPDPPFVLVRETAGRIAEGNHAIIDVALGRPRLEAGVHEAIVEIVTNDPLAPVLEVHVSVTVLGGPHLAIAGGVQVFESSLEFFEDGAVTLHSLATGIAPGGDGALEIGYEGDFSLSIENADLSLDGQPWATVARSATDCVFAIEVVDLPLDALLELTFDGVVEATLGNTAPVEALCPTNRHVVRLIYAGLYAPLEFPSVLVGGTAKLTLVIDNVGTETLEISSVTSDDPAFVASDASLTLEPGLSREITVDFNPTAAGLTAGHLVFESNDPDQPVLSIALRGTGTDPPVARFEPPRIDSDVLSGDVVERLLVVANDGSADLDFALIAVPAFSRVRPSSGTLAPGTAAELFVTLDGAGLTAGAHHGVLEIATNDPLLPAASIPVSLAVIDSPRLTVRGDPVVLESTESFDTPGAVTHHLLPTPGPATGDGRVEVVIVGDYGLGENASISAEGILVGTLGDLGIACVPTAGVYPLSLSTLGGLLEDGAVEIDVRNGPDVGVLCQDNTHTVRLVYPGTFDPLEFGETFTGRSRERHFVVANDGSLPLELAIESDAQQFAISPLDLNVAPGDEAPISVVFAPTTAGEISSSLEIHTNDPRAPLTVIALEGSGLDPPVLGVDPDEIDVTVPTGTRAALAVTIANDGASPLDFQVAVDSVPDTPGVTIEPGSGSIAPHGALRLDVGIDALTNPPGTYDRAIAIHSNDPVRPEVVVPLRIEVTDRPVIEVSPHRLDFGSLFVGASRRLPLALANPGSAPLQVTSIESDLFEILASPGEILVPAGETVETVVTFAPRAVESVEGRLTILSNDPDRPVTIVETHGRALPPPRAGVVPGSVEVALPPRSTRTRAVSLELVNDGLSPLGWSRVRGDGISADRVAGWVSRAKGDDTDAGAGSIAGQRLDNQDAFGYRFRDSDESGGPPFEWTDISEIGTPLPLTADDQNSGVIFLGFEFPFYGHRFASVNVCTNGWLSFTNTRAAFSNSDALPDTGYGVPENLIAPFWDDLDPRGVERIFVFRDGARFIVQFTAIDRFSSAAELTFQVELRADGMILFRYLTMSGVLDSATIGLQNGDKTRGLLVSYNEDYVHDALAVELVPGWISAEPTTGIVPSGGISEIELVLNSEFLDAGDRATRWTVSTDDPENETLSVPVLLHVREVTLDRAVLTPRTIQLSSRLRWIRAALQLPAGYDPDDILVSSVSIGGVLFARPDWKQIRDTDADGVDELIVKFDAREFLERFASRGLATVTITGEVENQTWFTGTATIRIPRP